MISIDTVASPEDVIVFRADRLFALLLLALPVAASSTVRPETGQFLQPSSFVGRVGDKVKLAVSSGGIAEPAAAEWPGQGIEWLYVRVAGTQRNMHGAGLKPARVGDRFFELTLEHAGATMIGMDRKSPARLWTAVEVAKLLEQTPDAGSGARPAAGKPARVRQIDSSKILLSVAAAGVQAGHSGVPQSKSGQIAEIRLMADPLRTPVGAVVPLRVYLHGSSRGGAIVYATNVKSGETHKLTTNAAGMATLKVSHTGVWQLKCRHVERAENDPDADWTSYLSTFTFEIPEGSRP